MTMAGSILRLQARQPRIGVAEVIQLNAHPIHEGEVQAAHFPILRGLAQIIERAAGLERPAQASGEQHGQSAVVVRTANEQAGKKHQA